MATYVFEHYPHPPVASIMMRPLDKAVIEAKDDTAAIRLARDRAFRLRFHTDFAVLLDENASEIWVWRNPLS